MPFSPTDYDPYDFANRRHIGPSPAEMSDMLNVVSAPSLDALIDQTVPESIRQVEPLEIGEALSERELTWTLRQIAKKNRVNVSMIGQGYYGTVTPPATMISDLTGLEVANASLLDEATAAAEAMVMAQRVAKSKAQGFFIDENCHPQTIGVVKTRAEPLGIEVIVGAPEALDSSKVFAAIFQYPGTYGQILDFTDEMAALHAAKAIGIVAADPLALTLLKEPGAMGADIAIGSTQRFGVPMGFGGPHAAYIACRDCKRASSISGGRRRPQMSAPRRRFLQ